MSAWLIYLLGINGISSLVFAYDKVAAVRHSRRVSERSLHLLELVGGVFAVLFLMYAIRHKNQKARYYLITYLFLILWLVAGGWNILFHA